MVIKRVLIGLLAWLIVMLSGCFVQWTFDFGAWVAADRFLLIGLALVAGVSAATASDKF